MSLLRAALFVIMFSAGSFFCETFGWLASGEAWLASGFTAALVVFFVPEPGRKRDPKFLIFLLTYVIVGYGVFFNLQGRLTRLVGSWLAQVLCLLLFLAIGLTLIVGLFMRRPHSRANNID